MLSPNYNRKNILIVKDLYFEVQNELLKLLVYFTVLIFFFYGFWFLGMSRGAYYRITFSHTDNFLFGRRSSTLRKSSLAHTVPCSDALEAVNVAETICGRLHPQINGSRYLLKPLRNISLAFVGDSRIRDVFQYIRSMLRGHPFKPTQFFHDDIYRNHKRNLTISFYWSPYPNYVVARLASKWKFDVMDPPKYAVMHFGAWSVMKFGGNDQSLSKFLDGLQAAATIFNDLRKKTVAIWMETLPGNPFTTRYDSWVKQGNNTAAIQQFGEKFIHLIVREKQQIWTTAHDIAARDIQLYRDHIHPGTPLIQKFVCQLLSSMEKTGCGIPR